MTSHGGYIYRIGFSGRIDDAGHRRTGTVTIMEDDLIAAIDRAVARLEKDGFKELRIWSANHITTVDLDDDQKPNPALVMTRHV